MGTNISMKILKHYPNRLRELRKKSRISQEVLGDEIGCNKSKISKLERGEQELTQNWMIRISKALNKHGLNTTPSDLLPPEQVYYSQDEKACVETMRVLKESNKPEFDAIMQLIKKESK